MRYFLSFSLIIFISLSSFAVGGDNDNAETTIVQKKEVKFVGVSKPIRLAPLDTVTDFLKKITVKGEARVQAIYRSMSESYADMSTPDKNLSFQSYPTGGAGAGNGSAVPLINLNFLANPTPDFSVDLGYALGHNFNGTSTLDGDTSNRSIAVRSNLNFTGKLSTSYGLFKIRAGGGVLWTSLSPMTISQNEFQNDGFDKLPWDWYTKSFEKYNAMYEGSAQLGSETFGSEVFQGVDLQGAGLPGGFGFIAMYGRTNRSVDAAKALATFPSSVFAGRVDNSIGNTIIGVNFYNQINDTTASNVVTGNETIILNGDTMIVPVVGKVQDNRQIFSTDIRHNINGIEIYTEIAMGRVVNPKNSGDWDNGFIVTTNIPESKLGIPIKAKIYNIGHEVVSNVSTVMNSNDGAPNNGVNQDPNYRTTVFINGLQQVGQVANNRRGFSATTGKKIGRVKVELGYGLSQEIDNIYNAFTFQHRSNSFSRSRFTPWLQTAGPYKRIKNNFRRAFEIIQITDAENGIATDYNKGFNQLDLDVKYKMKVARRSMVIRNFTNISSVQDGIAFIPKMSDGAFLQAYYNQTLLFYALSKKVTLLGMFEFERNIGNTRTELSSYNRKPINQYSEGLGVGVDYDFSEYAGLYVRHRWMYHDDINFVKDKFQGQETTVELKVFF